jgi:hypothetical protein
MKGEVKAKITRSSLVEDAWKGGDVFQTKRKFEKPKNAAHASPLKRPRQNHHFCLTLTANNLATYKFMENLKSAIFFSMSN